MKQIILKTFVVTLALSGTTAFAEGNGSNSPKPLPLKIIPVMKEVRLENKGELKDLKPKMATSTASTTKAMRIEMEKKHIEEKFQKMIDRFEATIEREEAIMARIVSRIEKMKGGGIKTEEVDKLIADAKTQFANAKTALETLKTSAENASLQTTGTTTAKDGLQAMKKAVMEIEKYLRAGHKDLEKAVGNLKGYSSIKTQLPETKNKETN